MKLIASWYVVPRIAAPVVSAIPRITPPTRGPTTFPRPPSTVTTKALPSSGDPCNPLFESCDEEADACVPLSEGCQSDADCDADEYCETDTGLCQPEVAQNCGPGAGNCFVANFTPGCESQSCCDSVCQFDVTCCLVAWDEDCASMAYSFCPQSP